MRAFLIEEQKIVKKVCIPCITNYYIWITIILTLRAGNTGPQGSCCQEEVEQGREDKIKSVFLISVNLSFSGREIPSLGVNRYVENVKQKANTKRRLRGVPCMFFVCFFLSQLVVTKRWTFNSWGLKAGVQ